MKILVYGVTNWDDEEQANNQSDHLNEWHERVNCFIGDTEKVFITTGSYSDPKLNPTTCDVVQIPFFRPYPYSKQNCYFRMGFMTGIWHALMNYDFDILIHCQCRNLIGEHLQPTLKYFNTLEDQIMSPTWSSMVGTSIDVGFMAMKKKAALMYCATGYRQNCDQSKTSINCEEEAYLMFNNSWFNPWPETLTCRPYDISYHHDSPNYPSIYDLTPEQIKELPIIATGKHCNTQDLEQWKNNHPIK